MANTETSKSTVPPNTTAKWRSAIALAGWLILCFGAAAIGSLFMPGDWYTQLKKPSWNPPSWIFGPVWTALYTLMAIAAWLVWMRGGFAGQTKALVAFAVQLGFNAIWSPLFFGLRSLGLAFVDILFLWVALLITIRLFWKTRPIAGALLIPYAAWVSFAAALNYTIWQLNR
ncbi:MAG TPA: tryptophan-rich sensory protein [Verrucomicrobiota bacterium]|nr:tryptophan-rich sensory protein [Verrucomicrobiota bacterium]